MNDSLYELLDGMVWSTLAAIPILYLILPFYATGLLYAEWMLRLTNPKQPRMGPLRRPNWPGALRYWTLPLAFLAIMHVYVPVAGILTRAFENRLSLESGIAFCVPGILFILGFGALVVRSRLHLEPSQRGGLIPLSEQETLIFAWLCWLAAAAAGMYGVELRRPSHLPDVSYVWRHLEIGSADLFPILFAASVSAEAAIVMRGTATVETMHSGIFKIPALLPFSGNLVLMLLLVQDGSLVSLPQGTLDWSGAIYFWVSIVVTILGLVTYSARAPRCLKIFRCLVLLRFYHFGAFLLVIWTMDLD